MTPLYNLFTVTDPEGNILWQDFNRTNVADAEKGRAYLQDLAKRCINKSRGGGKLVVAAHVGGVGDFTLNEAGEITTGLGAVKTDSDYDWNDVNELQRKMEREAEFLRTKRERGEL